MNLRVYWSRHKTRVDVNVLDGNCFYGANIPDLEHKSGRYKSLSSRRDGTVESFWLSTQ